MLSSRVLRPPTPEVVDIVEQLEAAAAARDGHESLGSFSRRDLAAPAPESIGILATDGDDVVGYAHLAPSDTLTDPHLVAAIVVDPDHRTDGEVARTLLETLVQEAAATDARKIVLWVNGADEDLDRLVQGAGFEPFSAEFQMRVPLPLTETAKWPPDVSVRSFVPGADDAAWLRVNNRSFRNHPDQGAWAEATLQRRIAEPWFDPDGFLLAFDPQEQLAGFCWTKVHEPDGSEANEERMGEIYVIGVDPDHQGTGLGRALTVGGLEHLARERHCPIGLLYVDAANTAALGLYRALGFTTFRTDRAYTWTGGSA